jgi:hypothetical protein
MSKSSTFLLVGAALAGLLTGTGYSAQSPAPTPTPDARNVTDDTTPTHQHRQVDRKEKHACKGQNSCKGKGGCKSSDNGCKGRNSCKGKGGCNIDGKSMGQEK